MKSKFQQIIDFIKSTYNNKEIIPLHEPRFFGNEKKYLEECINTGFVSSVGKFVSLFEKEIANYTGANHAIACVNGTAALHLALVLSDVKRNDEVITQPLSFIATANAIAYTGASPVFIDIDRVTLGLSPDSLRAFLQEHAKICNGYCINRLTGNTIKACVPMHTFGNPCLIDEIIDICSSYNIKVVEDAAESIGSFFKGKHTGTFGDIGIFSFNGNKTITTGGGGMLVTNSKELAGRIKHFSTQAKVRHPWAFFHDETGFNYRMPNVNAALGIAQLENIDKILNSKRKLSLEYAKLFKNLGLQSIQETPGSDSNFWLNGFFVKTKKEREEFLEQSNSSGVQCRPAWNLLNTQPMYQNCIKGNIDISESISETLVNVPSSAVLKSN